MLVDRLPAELSREVGPGHYPLRRGERLGPDRAVFMLPRDFPASVFTVTVADQPDRVFRVRPFDGGPGLVLPDEVVPTTRQAGVDVIDPAHGVARIVIEER